jgi:hypothetical protein
MGGAERKKSLQDVLRERRETKPLVGVKELRLREAERRRQELESLARERVERWRREGMPVDADGKLEPELYRAVFARSPDAYFSGRHWSRRSRAQLGLSAICAVERCDREADLVARHLGYEAVGEEQAGRDLITLCTGCLARARRLEEELGRAPQRDELRRLDPSRPLYDAASIAALKARHLRPPGAEREP